MEMERTTWMWLGVDPFQDCLRDTRFADAGLAGDQNYLAVAPLGLLPPALQ
jgi:hypothetical protein